MSVRYEAQPSAAETHARPQEAAPAHERFTVPTEAPDFETASPDRSPQSHNHMHGSGSRFEVTAASTRWTKGRGNKSLLSRGVGVIAETFITAGAIFVRGGLYALRDAYTWGRAVLAFGTGILKDFGHVGRAVGFFAMLPVALVGAACGAVHGAVVGAATAAYDGYRGITSVASGGEAYYFKFANRAYRD
jgi:hypothetical protein